jgi:histone acetyltransferase MYST1
MTAYGLAKKECKVEASELPLSNLGLVSNIGYWTRVLLEIRKKHKSNLFINVSIVFLSFYPTLLL